MGCQVKPIRKPIRAALALAAALLASCGGGEAPAGQESMARQVFIDAYVDLRLAAMESEDFTVTPARRDEILARHGTDQETLLRFADVHGPDLEYMNEVWAEVDRLLQERMPSEATSATGLTLPRSGA